ncbi:MAG: hypothetical protein AAF231_13555, partial [Pseudomonadota bacterium]
NGRSIMYITDPFQFSAAGYRLMGVMVEQQMRVMKVMSDAALTSNPLLTSPVPRRDVVAPATTTTKPKTKSVTHLAKPATRPTTASSNRQRQPSPPPAFPQSPTGGTVAHPAE